uniref:Reverse transcriptase domain-containing protein n=1 Tax=Tanacetum cinerariifolium TaxID=118510 RepID=A0A699J6C9_TANCI|nr:hypothetical protein [Tanacetum cinerariifolium]
MADYRTMAQLLQAPTEGYEDAIVVPAITADNFELKHGLLTLRSDESFSEAWDRFKDLLRACPHHGFSELHQLYTFYNALNSKDQDSLNSTAGGKFLDKMPRECLAIIESKSKVRYSCNKPVSAKVSTNTSASGISPDVVELKDMVNALLLDKKSQNQSPALMKAVEESCVTCGGAHFYRNTSYPPPIISNQIRPPRFPPVPNNQNVQLNQRNNQIRFNQNQNQGNNFNQGPVYQSPVFQPPAYQAPAYQASAPQTQGVSKENFSAYVKANDAVLRNMQTQGQNMQNQLTNLTDLITKFMNSNSASTSSLGTLPSNTIANSRSDLKAITTRSSVSYDGPQIPPLTSFLPKVVEDEPETKGTVQPTNNGSTKDVQPQVVQSESQILTSEPVISPIFEPIIAPIFKDMSFEISFADALILMPKFTSTLKALIGNKEKLSKMARTPLNEHCSAVLLKKLPEKLGDPGKFLIPCNFPGMAECLALADLGASINLMPFVWKRLYLPDLTPTCMTLELADHLISRPVGVAEDVYCMQTRSSSRLVSNPSSYPTPSTNPNPKCRNRRRSKQRIEEFNLEELSPPIVTMADQRIMAQLLQEPTEGYEDAIVVPAITADNFELKHGLLTLVQNKQFFGHDKEDPHAKVRYFNKITSTLKFPNVSNPSIKLMLFPFSLEGAAQIWLEKEPP